MKGMFDMQAEFLVVKSEETFHFAIEAEFFWEAVGADCVEDAKTSTGGIDEMLERENVDVLDREGVGIRTGAYMALCIGIVPTL